jgi:hypothetical protein
MYTRANLKDIGEFVENKNIKLQIPKNKIDIISKRRFIHSYDHIQNNIIIDTKNYSESDTV